ncbi:MAG: DUF445 family protein [Alphaproteobacteria bacterium]|nr:DUF445 family protein [Alphaproteobacteria bacterium]
MVLKIFLIPLVSAFIGWITNFIAVKMLFHPRQPKRILGLTIQGVFPKRKERFAAQIAQTFGTEIIQASDFKNKLTSPENIKKLTPQLGVYLDQILKKKLQENFPFISNFIGEETLTKLKKSVLDELIVVFPKLIEDFFIHLKDEFDVEKMITEKILQFSDERFELMLLKIMKDEFKFIEIIGGVLGFIIGVIQIIILYLF